MTDLYNHFRHSTVQDHYLHLQTHLTFSAPFPGTPVPGCYRLYGTTFTPANLPLPPNTKVKAGCLIALSGKAGTVAPHLHFEVLVGGVHRNPTLALRNTGGGEPLAAVDRSAFADLRARFFARLDSVVSRSSLVAHSGGSSVGVARADAARNLGEE